MAKIVDPYLFNRRTKRLHRYKGPAYSLKVPMCSKDNVEMNDVDLLEKPPKPPVQVIYCPLCFLTFCFGINHG